MHSSPVRGRACFKAQAMQLSSACTVCCSEVQVACNTASAVGVLCRPKDAGKAKYLLQHTVRIHMGANDDAFGCMGQKEDMAGLPGVFLKTNVVKVAGEALARNLRTLGRLALPVSEKVSHVMLAEDA